MAFDKFLWKNFLPEDFQKPKNRFEKSGALIIDKPEGISSMDLIRFFKVLGNIKKAGHAGTLDPMATGLMVVLINQATKLSNRLMEGDKEYEGTLQFGQEYDTQDITGTPVGAFQDYNDLLSTDLNALCSQLTGEIEQIPPIYSAIKKGGKPLYSYARKDLDVDIEARKVKVHRFEITEFLNDGSARFFVHCEKGVYVRTLIHDLGKLAGVNAAMSSLRRIRSGNFSIEKAKKLNDFKNQDDIEKNLILPEVLLENQ